MPATKHKPKQVYEWGLLRIAKDDKQASPTEITSAQWEALGKYNEAHGNRFFTVQTNGIRFNQYVGVVQVGNQTIEILPKVDKKEPEDEQTMNKWQSVLIDMLRQCHWLDQQAHQHAPLRIKHRSILEAYLALFLNHCEAILHRGLVKRYRQQEGNKYALKGKLMFAKNIRHNAFHAERFYTQHRVYDAQHLLNQILLKAIKLVPRLSTRSHLKDKVGRLLLDFPELPDVAVNEALFQRIRYDRKTAHYEEAIHIAAMLLLHYRPDVTGGHQHVLAILFDMNKLWEEYVYRQLKKQPGYTVAAQRKKQFWLPEAGRSFKEIKPDIVLAKKGSDARIIIDTKWKTPDGNKPADDELKQMFAYNEYWEAGQAVLLYPNQDYLGGPSFSKGYFCRKKDEPRHGCSMMRVSVLDKAGGKLNPDVGKEMLQFLEVVQVL